MITVTLIVIVFEFASLVLSDSEINFNQEIFFSLMLKGKLNHDIAQSLFQFPIRLLLLCSKQVNFIELKVKKKVIYPLAVR